MNDVKIKPGIPREIRLWKEYRDWVDEQNKPAFTMWKNIMEADMKRYKKDKKRYKKEMKAWEKKQKQVEKQISDWEKLPWYKKMWKEEPRRYKLIPHYTQPRLPYTALSIPYIPTVQLTMEGFMNWRLENNK